MSLTDIKGVGSVIESKLRSLGILDINSFVERLPRTYIDLSKVIPLKDACDGSYCLLDIVIISKSKILKGKRATVFSAEGQTDSRTIKLIWYNSAYAIKMLQIGETYTFYGKIKFNNYCYEMNNPSFEKKTEHSKFCGLQPIYQTKATIPQRTYWALIKEALALYSYTTVINRHLEEKHSIMPIKDAYHALHIPQNTDFVKAKERIALEKIVRRLGAYTLAKNSEECANIYQKVDISTLIDSLDFTLSPSQVSAVEGIIGTLVSDKKLNAILCGDVGSGKTIVAIIACYFVIKNGYQAAFMAPTEILAKQHYDKINAIFSTHGIKTALLTGSTAPKERELLIDKVQRGEMDILVGTHSLINEGVKFNNLAMAVVDEQHRYGVAQRTKLIDKANCDVLTLSATPIPRSMQLIAYGAVQFINIEKRFLGNVATRIVREEKRQAMWEYVVSYCLSGGQAFVVAPKIFDAEGVESESVLALYEEIANYAADIKVGLLHGKLKSQTKQKLITDFSAKKISILVSTTVIEVGIDVPDAGIMVIMDAEKFGLATLHQLRGRIGRKGQKAYCFLYTDKSDSQNLAVMTTCNDGFLLAEADFDKRGSGELLGLEQSGSSSLHCLSLKLIKKAKKIADEINFEQYFPLLCAEIDDYCLTDVTLN